MMNTLEIGAVALAPAKQLKDLLPCEFLNPWYAQCLWVLGMTFVTMALSGVIVRKLIGDPPSKDTPQGKLTHRTDPGAVIGKCENILVMALVLMGQYEGLGLLFAAKSIARMEQSKENPSYYLGGTLVNVTWSVLVAMLTRVTLLGFAE